MQFEKKEMKKMKYVMSLLLSASALFGFGGCDTCAKVPLEVPVDFSKKGTVYESDFKAPWNIWGSLVQFNLMVGFNVSSSSLLSEQEKKIDNYIWNGHPENITPCFKVKITLTSIGWASEDVTVILNSAEWRNRKEKHYTTGQKIEEIVSVPLYGGEKGHVKTIMIADLQRLRNYHVRVESLEDVELPKGVSTKFVINRFSTKH